MVNKVKKFNISPYEYISGIVTKYKTNDLKNPILIYNAEYLIKNDKLDTIKEMLINRSVINLSCEELDELLNKYYINDVYSFFGKKDNIEKRISPKTGLSHFVYQTIINRNFSLKDMSELHVLMVENYNCPFNICSVIDDSYVDAIKINIIEFKN